MEQAARKFASTGTKDPKASDVLYISALAAPNTINTMPEKTLLAFGDHGKLAGTLPRDGGDCEAVLDDFRKAEIDLERLAADLQSDGAKSFDESWQNLLSAIKSKSKELQPVFLIGEALGNVFPVRAAEDELLGINPCLLERSYPSKSSEGIQGRSFRRP